MSVCLNRHNYQNQDFSFSIVPRNGYTGSNWQKLKPNDSTQFHLRTYQLRINHRQQPIIPCIYHIQLIEQVSWTHRNGFDFTQDLLKRFDLQESQYSIYKNIILHREDAPSTLQLFNRMVSFYSLFQVKYLFFFNFQVFKEQDHPTYKRVLKYTRYILKKT